MQSINSKDERVNRIIKNKLQKDELVVDDLFALSLGNCKKSNLQYALICEEIITKDETKKLVEYYKTNTDCFSISKKTLDRIASKNNCAGIVLVTKLEQKKLDKQTSFVLVCDGLEISGNIGTIFRTCESVNIDLIIFTNIKANIIDNKILHASRGMIFNVPFLIENDVQKVNELLDEFDFRKIVCEPEQGIDFKEFNYNNKVALVVGSERFGVDKLWFNSKNVEFLKIKMFGEMDSLNVAVATSLILYEAKYDRK